MSLSAQGQKPSALASVAVGVSLHHELPQLGGCRNAAAYLALLPKHTHQKYMNFLAFGRSKVGCVSPEEIPLLPLGPGWHSACVIHTEVSIEELHT